ncbi:hypothetical protein CGRA01v4_08321 [Colletotrichum graminicola]|uniref:Uncharacterized protein n=1 Tax=Colletotrichum graminicola (strain M1.001 / M2 / FGSC 10212) TaxID=645133 RepID=E3QMI6_COLGM|nr:uncharacterized protein GLRG_07218 [Colletotrichum graminicola M1.001]EFQ32074.1 hypothetical protein GLRG_07218 [Colletotrichum graminicola M1.001]WDK17038.1 hypothetical protein CGRA01v4_08321 [Colletotrichum graminicola]
MQIASIPIATMTVREDNNGQLTFIASDDMWKNIGKRFEKQSHHEIASDLSRKILLIKTRE